MVKLSISTNDSSDSSLQIKLGALMSYIAIFFNMAAGILYTPWMIKQIGQSDYGLYTLALSIIFFFTIDFGLGQTVARFLSKYNAENDETRKSDFLGITFKLYLIIDVIILALLVTVFIQSGTIYAELTPAELEKFRIVFIIAAFYAIGSFPFQPLNGVLISYERFAFQKLVDLIYRILTVTIMVIVLVFGYQLYALVIVNAITGFIAIGLKLNYIIMNRLIKVNFKAWNRKIFKDITIFSGWSSIIILSQRLTYSISPSILAAFSGSVQIAQFAIASAIEGYVWTFAFALNGLFLPKVTNILLKKDSSEEIENLMIKVGRIQLTIVGLLYAGFLTLGKEFVILWLNEDFVISYYVAVFLISPSIITVTQEIANTALVAKNKLKYQAFGLLMVGAVSIFLSIILTQKYGAIGVGIGIFVGNVFGSVIYMNIVYSKILQINIGRFFRECHFKMIIPIGITIIIGLGLKLLPSGTWIILFIKIMILSVIYLALMWVVTFNEFEKSLFRRFLKKLKKRV